MEDGFNQIEKTEEQQDVISEVVGDLLIVVSLDDLQGLATFRDVEWHVLGSQYPEASSFPEMRSGGHVHTVSKPLLINLHGVFIKGFFCASDSCFWFADEGLNEIVGDTWSFATIG